MIYSKDCLTFAWKDSFEITCSSFHASIYWKYKKTFLLSRIFLPMNRKTVLYPYHFYWWRGLHLSKRIRFRILCFRSEHRIPCLLKVAQKLNNDIGFSRLPSIGSSVTADLTSSMKLFIHFFHTYAARCNWEPKNFGPYIILLIVRKVQKSQRRWFISFCNHFSP